MRAFYQKVLIIVFLSVSLPNVYAMSKPFQTDVSIILIDNRPCAYVVGSDGGDVTKGIELYGDHHPILLNNTIPASNSKSTCRVPSGPNYVFKTNTVYKLALGGGGYAYTTFCLMRDNMNNLFLSEITDDGQNCTTIPHQNPEDKSRWQRLKDWW